MRTLIGSTGQTINLAQVAIPAFATIVAIPSSVRQGWVENETEGMKEIAFANRFLPENESVTRQCHVKLGQGSVIFGLDTRDEQQDISMRTAPTDSAFRAQLATGNPAKENVSRRPLDLANKGFPDCERLGSQMGCVINVADLSLSDQEPAYQEFPKSFS